jgi:hypothetical protein
MISVSWSHPDASADWGGYDPLRHGIPMLTGWRLFYRRASALNLPWKQLLPVDWSVSQMSFTVGSLRADTAYEFRLRAMNPQAVCFEPGLEYLKGNADPLKYMSEVTKVTTLHRTPPGTVDDIVSGVAGVRAVTAMRTGGRVMLEVDNPFDDGGVGFEEFSKFDVVVLLKSGTPLKSEWGES